MVIQDAKPGYLHEGKWKILHIFLLIEFFAGACAQTPAVFQISAHCKKNDRKKKLKLPVSPSNPVTLLLQSACFFNMSFFT